MSYRDICSKCGQMYSLHNPDRCPRMVATSNNPWVAPGEDFFDGKVQVVPASLLKKAEQRIKELEEILFSHKQLK